MIWSRKGPKGVKMALHSKQVWALALGCLAFLHWQADLLSCRRGCPAVRDVLPWPLPLHYQHWHSHASWYVPAYSSWASRWQLCSLFVHTCTSTASRCCTSTTTLIRNLRRASFWPGWLTTDKTVLFLAGCPQSWLSTGEAAPPVGWAMYSRVWETGKQFVCFGNLRLGSLLPFEGAVEEAICY